MKFYITILLTIFSCTAFAQNDSIGSYRGSNDPSIIKANNIKMEMIEEYDDVTKNSPKKSYAYYDTLGRLLYNKQILREKTNHFIYDSLFYNNNQLILVKHFSQFNEVESQWGVDSIVYNNKENKKTSITNYKSSSGVDEDITDYYFNKNGQIIAANGITKRNDTLQFLLKDNYSYDNEGRLKMKRQVMIAKDSTVNTTTYEYKKNKTIVTSLYYGITSTEEWFYNNQHQCIKTVSHHKTYDYIRTFKYNKDGTYAESASWFTNGTNGKHIIKHTYLKRGA